MRDARLTRIFRLDDSAQLGMFGMHTLVQTQRQWEHLSGPNKGNRTKVETSGNSLACVHLPYTDVFGWAIIG